MTEIDKRKLPIIQQVSAGGVVYRERDGRFQIVIVAVNPTLRWQLPKGIVDEGETPEMTAVREVREEAGVNAELLMMLDTIEYWYAGNIKDERVRFHKFVHFYLMKYRDGSIEDHDHEIAEARWVEINESLKMLTFKSEREIVQKAIEMIK